LAEKPVFERKLYLTSCISELSITITINYYYYFYFYYYNELLRQLAYKEKRFVLVPDTGSPSPKLNSFICFGPLEKAAHRGGSMWKSKLVKHQEVKRKKQKDLPPTISVLGTCMPSK
jgi:hypothetical protein